MQSWPGIFATEGELRREFADEHFELQARGGLRGFDGEVGGGRELNAARDLGSGATLQRRDVRVAFEWREVDVAEDFFATAASEQVLAECQPVIVSCN